MKKMKLIFEKGGELIVHFNDFTPNTVKCIQEILPCENYLMHSRYCGREVCFGVITGSLLAKENNVSKVEKFDVGYWRDWDHSEKREMQGSPGAEAISFYYGAEHLRFQDRHISVNVFGRIDESQESLLVEIGTRIWQQGFENVKAELIEL